jgi:proline iminopeptidase
MTDNKFFTKSHKAFKSGGFTLNYTIEGNGIPAIVIGSHKYYPRIFSQNLRNHMQLVFMDQRAFGNAVIKASEEDFALSKLLDDIEALRREFLLDKIVIIGHSIHALMAMEYAKKYPDSVSKVVLIASSPMAGSKVQEAADRYFADSVCPTRKEALANNLRTLDDEIAAHPDQAFITRMLKFGPMIWYDFTYDASWLWEDVSLNPLGAELVWGSMFKDLDIEKNLSLIKCPVFLALGRYDYWNPPYLWEGSRSKFKDLTIRVFEKSAHTPQLEEAEAFDRELLEWLDIKNERIC